MPIGVPVLPRTAISATANPREHLPPRDVVARYRLSSQAQPVMPEESNNQHSDPSPFGADEFPVDDLAFGEPLPETGSKASASGNRPADGARQVSPDEILSTGFDGSENAGDFLGLDMEFTGAMEEAAPELDLAKPLAVALDAQPAAEPAADYDAEFDLDGPTQIMHADEGGDYEEYDDGYGEEEFAEGDEFDGEFEAESGGRGKLIAIALGVGVLAFAGVKFGPQFLNKDKTTAPTQVASNTNTAPTAGDASLDASGDAGAATSDPTVESAIDPLAVASTDPGAIDSGSTDPETTTDAFDAASDALAAAVKGATNGDATTVDTSGFETSPMDLLLGGDATEGLPDSIDPAVAASVGMSAGGESFPEFEAGYEWVSPDMLDMVWRGSNIPMEAIAAPARTLMPRVGHVRVHMLSGETIDGRLYAVGQKRVWIDVEPGRIGLDGDSVESFERLAIPSDVEGGAIETTPVPISGRVAAEAPGGLIYGRILARGESTVTLVCDDGSKITLRNPTIHPVTENRAILVQR